MCDALTAARMIFTQPSRASDGTPSRDAQRDVLRKPPGSLGRVACETAPGFFGRPGARAPAAVLAVGLARLVEGELHVPLARTRRSIRLSSPRFALRVAVRARTAIALHAARRLRARASFRALRFAFAPPFAGCSSNMISALLHFGLTSGAALERGLRESARCAATSVDGRALWPRAELCSAAIAPAHRSVSAVPSSGRLFKPSVFVSERRRRLGGLCQLRSNGKSCGCNAMFADRQLREPATANVPGHDQRRARDRSTCSAHRRTRSAARSSRSRSGDSRPPSRGRRARSPGLWSGRPGRPASRCRSSPSRAQPAALGHTLWAAAHGIASGVATSGK